MKIVRKALIFLIGGLRPILGPATCKYPIGCTQFAIEQLESEPFFRALWRSFIRVLSCNPFSKTESTLP